MSGKDQADQNGQIFKNMAVTDSMMRSQETDASNQSNQFHNKNLPSNGHVSRAQRLKNQNNHMSSVTNSQSLGNQ